MKPWQRQSVGIPANPNPDVITAPTPPPAPATPLGQPQPLAPAETDLSLAQRVSGLEQKAFYDGQYIANLRAELSAAGQCIDALAARLDALAQRVNSGAGNSQPVADNPPDAPTP